LEADPKDFAVVALAEVGPQESVIFPRCLFKHKCEKFLVDYPCHLFPEGLDLGLVLGLEERVAAGIEAQRPREGLVGLLKIG
jgi:hypothetical protein